MSKVSKKSLIASTIVGALALAGSNIALADSLSDLQKAENKIFKASAKSQEKINNIYSQSQELLAEYRTVVDEYENLKVYNDHVQRLVDDQNAGIASLESQISEVDNTKKGVVPLMYKMIDSLEQFIEKDIPVNLKDRKARVSRIKDVMSNSSITTSERFRLVLEAYEIETDYGSMFSAYQGELEFEGQTMTVDFVHLGRVALVAQSLDMKNAWLWNNSSRQWEKLGDEYLSSTTTAIRMARKQIAPELIKLPIFAAEAK
jgi:regulator of replication initiation timing